MNNDDVTPDLPDGYMGAGPVFAAVPLGDPWYNLAVRGATTYVVERPVSDPEAPVEGAAFLDRAQAEAVADGIADGEFTRYEGLAGYYECTPARAAAGREAAQMYAATLTPRGDAAAGHEMPEAGS